jgi:hypothetical protein
MSLESPIPSSQQQSNGFPVRSLLQFPSSAAHTVPLLRGGIGYDQQSHMGTTDINEVLSAKEILGRHNIEPSSLSLAQLKLFEHAPADQRLRLIYMWQILSQNSGHIIAESANVSTPRSESCRMDIGNQGNHFWDSQSHSQEEQCQGTREPTMDYQDQMDDGMCEFHDAEPYMISGYEALARRDYDFSAGRPVTMQDTVAPLRVEPTTGSPYNLASDPVFGGKRWWEHTEIEPMERQYGVFEQINQSSGRALVAAHWLHDGTGG